LESSPSIATLDGLDRGCDLHQADELLAREPADLVELVHAHVDRNPAARTAELGTRRVGIPLPAGDERDLTQLSGEDAPSQFHELRYESSPVADLQQHPRVLAGATRGRDLLRRGAARLLTQDRKLQCRTCCDELSMQRRRRGDQHCLDATGGDRTLDTRVRPYSRADRLGACERTGRRIDDRHNPHRWRPGERSQVRTAHAPRTNDRQVQPIIDRHLERSINVEDIRAVSAAVAPSRRLACGRQGACGERFRKERRRCECCCAEPDRSALSTLRVCRDRAAWMTSSSPISRWIEPSPSPDV
jgi:hypothetical protein